MSVALPLVGKILRSSGKKVELRGISASFGDDYGQRAARGLASARDSWEVTWEALTISELQALQVFFYEQGTWGVLSYTPPYEDSSKIFRAANSLTSSFDGLRHWTASIALIETTIFADLGEPVPIPPESPVVLVKIMGTGGSPATVVALAIKSDINGVLSISPDIVDTTSRTMVANVESIYFWRGVDDADGVYLITFTDTNGLQKTFTFNINFLLQTFSYT